MRFRFRVGRSPIHAIDESAHLPLALAVIAIVGMMGLALSLRTFVWFRQTVPAEAEVVAVHVERDRCGKRSCARFEVDIAYPTPEGRLTVEGMHYDAIELRRGQEVDDVPAPIAVGDRVPVRYERRDPDEVDFATADNVYCLPLALTGVPGLLLLGVAASRFR